MIVRILHDGQFDLDGETLQQVRVLDDRLLQTVADSDEAAFKSTLHSLIGAVHQSGRRLPDDSLKESHIVIPSEDFSLAEAQKLFQS